MQLGRKKTRIILILVFFFISILLITVAFVLRLNQIAVMNVEDQLVSKCNENNKLIDYTIENAEEDMKLFASSMSYYDDDIHSKNALIYADIQANILNYERIGLADLNGYTKTSDGNITNIVDRDYFKQALNGETNISNILYSSITKKKVITVCSPIYNKNVIVGAAYGLLNFDMISNFINLNNDDTMESYIINIDNDNSTTEVGEVVAQPKNGLFCKQTNLLDSMSEVLSKKSYNLLVEDINNMETGFVSFKNDGESYYVTYQKSSVDSWYVFSIVDKSSINTLINQANQLSSFIAISIICLTVAINVLIIFLFVKSEQKLRMAKEEAIHDEKRLSVALSKTKHMIFDYDTRIKKITFNTIDLFPEDKRSLEEKFVEKIKPEFMDLYNEFLDKVLNREEGAYVELILDIYDSEYWYSINSYNYEGSSKVLLILTDITEEKVAQQASIKDTQYKNAIKNHSLWSFEVDLDKNQFINCEKKFMDYLENVENKKYDNIIDLFIDQNVVDQFQTTIKNFLSKDYLMKEFRSGKDMIQSEARMLFYGEYKWIKIIVNLFKDPFTNNLICYAILNDISEEKNKQVKLQEKVDLDYMTLMYKREKFIDEFDKYVSQKSGDTYSACILVDLDNFKRVNDTFGHDCGDQVIIDFAKKVRNNIKKSDFCGRLGGDEFIIMLKNFKSIKEIKQRVEQLAKILILYFDFNGVKYEQTCSLGVDIIKEKVDFLTAYKNADIALYKTKNNGKGNVTFHTQ